MLPDVRVRAQINDHTTGPGIKSSINPQGAKTGNKETQNKPERSRQSTKAIWEGQ